MRNFYQDVKKALKQVSKLTRRRNRTRLKFVQPKSLDWIKSHNNHNQVLEHRSKIKAKGK